MGIPRTKEVKGRCHPIRRQAGPGLPVRRGARAVERLMHSFRISMDIFLFGPYLIGCIYSDFIMEPEKKAPLVSHHPKPEVHQ
jgi:hypothetical protein